MPKGFPRSQFPEMYASRKGKAGSRVGAMTVAEAGHMGGTKVRDKRGHTFYEEIGRKGGQKVRQLIEAGKRVLGKG